MTLQSLYALGYCIHRPAWARQSTHNVRARSQASHGAQGGGAAPCADSSPARIAETTPHHPRSHAAALQKMSPHHTLDVPHHRETRRYARARPTPAEVASSLRINDAPASHPRRPRTLDVLCPPPRRRDVPAPRTSTLLKRTGADPSVHHFPFPTALRPTPARTTMMPQTRPHEITNALYARTTATPPHGAQDTHTGTVRTHAYETPQHADDTARRIEIPTSATSSTAPHPRSAAPSNARAQSAARTPLAVPPRRPVVRPRPHRAPPSRSHHPPAPLAAAPQPHEQPGRAREQTHVSSPQSRLRQRQRPRLSPRDEARQAPADTKDAQGDGTHLHARTIRHPAAVLATARAYRQAHTRER
ncbi:hypothetical protein C8J57DRAFT_1718524 [Mycena rebaudengoi]|nr:hypothetical protein C8J57DRAFT_1718524 [Mycena rebaudengoi]